MRSTSLILILCASLFSCQSTENGSLTRVETITQYVGGKKVNITPRCNDYPKKITNWSDKEQEGFPFLRVEPKYPRRAAIDGITGYVTMEFGISSEGKPYKIHTIESYPSKTFISSAEKALSKWRFRPYIEKGEVIDSPCHTIRLDFKL